MSESDSLSSHAEVFHRNTHATDDHEVPNLSTSSSPSTTSAAPSNPLLAKIYLFSKKIDSLGVETTGIDRVPPDQRLPAFRQFVHVTGLWLSAAGGLSSMSSFLLGPLLFGLSFRDSLICGLVSVTVGCLIAGYCCTMGPQSGCRQMVTARYLFGWWWVRVVAIVAVLGVLGWSTVNAVVGGEMLAAISNDKVPIWVGVLIVTFASGIVAIFGIKHVLMVETYFSVPVLTIFLLLYISSSDKFHYVHDYNTDSMSRPALTGAWLSFFCLCYSNTSTWGQLASDYFIYFPEDTPSWQTFLVTFLGIAIPNLFVGVIGILLASVAVTYQPWNDQYERHGMGGLLWAGFERWNGFGKFCVVVLILSLISNNIISTYSAALCMQLSSGLSTKIPRWFWALVGTIIYLVCALVGRNHFSTILSNFLPMIGYWISIYFVLLFEENVIFRTHFHHLYTKEFDLEAEKAEQGMEETSDTFSGSRSAIVQFCGVKEKAAEFATETRDVSSQSEVFKGSRHHVKGPVYNWEQYDNYNVLTHGYAVVFAFCCGVAGVVVGMAQAYWIGPIARHFGKDGGDLGMWLSMGFSGVAYPVARYLELKKFGR